MSLRYWYRKSAKERICPICGGVIQRNIALHDGDPYHYGCLQQALQKKYRCQSCGAVLNTLETVKVTVAGRELRSCGFCGSTGIIPLYTWTPPQVNVIPEGST